MRTYFDGAGRIWE